MRNKIFASLLLSACGSSALYAGEMGAVDGGVNPDNIAGLAHAGATQFIVGSALFNGTDYAQTIASLQQQLRKTA